MSKETLEEEMYKASFENESPLWHDGFIKGAKWQEKKMYSEEDLKRAFEAGHKKGFSGYPNTENWKELPFEKWFEQFKKK